MEGAGSGAAVAGWTDGDVLMRLRLAIQAQVCGFNVKVASVPYRSVMRVAKNQCSVSRFRLSGKILSV